MSGRGQDSKTDPNKAPSRSRLGGFFWHPIARMEGASPVAIFPTNSTTISSSVPQASASSSVISSSSSSTPAAYGEKKQIGGGATLASPSRPLYTTPASIKLSPSEETLTSLRQQLSVEQANIRELEGEIATKEAYVYKLRRPLRMRQEISFDLKEEEFENFFKYFEADLDPEEYIFSDIKWIIFALLQSSAFLSFFQEKLRATPLEPSEKKFIRDLRPIASMDESEAKAFLRGKMPEWLGFNVVETVSSDEIKEYIKKIVSECQRCYGAGDENDQLSLYLFLLGEYLNVAAYEAALEELFQAKPKEEEKELYKLSKVIKNFFDAFLDITSFTQIQSKLKQRTLHNFAEEISAIRHVYKKSNLQIFPSQTSFSRSSSSIDFFPQTHPTSVEVRKELDSAKTQVCILTAKLKRLKGEPLKIIRECNRLKRKHSEIEIEGEASSAKRQKLS